MATSVDRIFGYSSLSAFRLPVRVATTANITLSGEQTVDGVSVVAGDRVLVKDQTDGTENGVYVAATGAWTRAEDFDGARDVVEGTMILCNNGSTQAGTVFRLTNSGPVIGSTSLTFASVITIGESGLQVGVDIQAYSTVLQTLVNAGTFPTITVTDLNDATADSFIYAGAGAANAPSGLSASAINGIVSAQGTDDLIQLVFGQSVTQLYMRAKNGGVWSSWERFLRFSDVPDDDDLSNSGSNVARRDNVEAYIAGLRFTSTGQTITPGGLITLAHGLGVRPRHVSLWIRCTDAGGDAGYAENDELQIGTNNDGFTTAAVSRPLAVYADETNINLRFNNQTDTIYTANKSTGNLNVIDETKWEIYVEASL